MKTCYQYFGQEAASHQRAHNNNPFTILIHAGSNHTRLTHLLRRVTYGLHLAILPYAPHRRRWGILPSITRTTKSASARAPQSISHILSGSNHEQTFIARPIFVQCPLSHNLLSLILRWDKRPPASKNLRPLLPRVASWLTQS